MPPLPEQHRIVAKIEELFSELDKGVESLKTARTQLKVYRQAVLKHAFEGKLTAQWREENKDKLETPEQLLARIKRERETRYERQLKEWKAAVSRTWEESGKPGKKPTEAEETGPHSSDIRRPMCWFSPNSQRAGLGSHYLQLQITFRSADRSDHSCTIADYLTGGTPLVNPSHILFQRIEPRIDL